VATGIETREEVEILEGLAEGERLVVKGHETLRDKSKVRVTE
jgi:multidrug efflux pump subunit AcrA (membrane-fusion protein)